LSATSDNTLTLSEYLASRRERFEAALRAWMSEDSARWPARLAEAMRYAVFPGGKRIRPLLAMAACECCGGAVESALPAACAVELIHCYSLVHDDLPAMDNDDMRRGRPTCHKVFGDGMAVLAGDALLTYAFELLASRCRPAELAAASCRLLAEAAGPAGMAGGQADDIELAGSWTAGAQAKAVSLLESLHRRKTGELIRASVLLGALAAGADAASQVVLERYGRELGLLFQVTDDLLDAGGDSAQAGQAAGKDQEQGKLTYPAVLGVERSRQLAAELHRRACASLEPFGEAARRLRELADLVLERKG